MIHDVDESLRRLLECELPQYLGPDISVQVTFGPPGTADGPDARTPRLNLYLHDVRENLALRDESVHYTRPARQPTQDPTGSARVVAERKRAPVRLDLSYIVTAHAPGDDALEHRLLSEALRVFLLAPNVPERFLVGELTKRGPSALPLSVADMNRPQFSEVNTLWAALQGRLRPALALIATPFFDPFEPVQTSVVREALLSVGQGATPGEPRHAVDVVGVRVSVAGVVTDGDGVSPLPGATVSIMDRDERARTDERGFFYMLNLPPGPQRIRIEKRGYQADEVDVDVPPLGRADRLTPVTRSLARLGDEPRAAEEAALVRASANAPALVECDREYRVSIVGTLRYPDGKPAAFVPVRSDRQWTTTDAQGVYAFYDVGRPEAPIVAEIPGRGEVEVKTERGTSLLALPPNPEPAAPQKGKAAKKEG